MEKQFLKKTVKFSSIFAAGPDRAVVSSIPGICHCLRRQVFSWQKAMKIN
jgi:hypothetical protein